MFFLLFRSHKQVSRCFIPMIMKWWHDELMKINILKSYSSGNNQYRGGSGWNNLKDRCFWLWQWYFVDFWHAIAHIHLSRSVSPPSPAMLGKPPFQKSAVFFNIVQTGGRGSNEDQLVILVYVILGGRGGGVELKMHDVILFAVFFFWRRPL